MAVLKFENRLGIYTSNMGGKEQWQTIGKKIRAAASRAEANKLRVVRVVNRKPAADKDSRADSKVARVARVDSRAVRRVISKATADLFEEEVSSLELTFILIGRSQARAP